MEGKDPEIHGVEADRSVVAYYGPPITFWVAFCCTGVVFFWKIRYNV